MKGEERVRSPGLGYWEARGDPCERSWSGEELGAQWGRKPPGKGREGERGGDAGASETRFLVRFGIVVFLRGHGKDIEHVRMQQLVARWFQPGL